MRLGGTDLTVSPLGFGTAALGRSLSRRERVRLLETAFACGITHFDTAPLYGAGAAEEALGTFLRHARDQVTVATKVGIRQPGTAALCLSRLVNRLAHAQSGLFAPADVRASLDGSLRRLRTSRVDLLLLHEVTAADVSDGLLATLDEAVARGDVGHLGVATSSGETATILQDAGAFPSVVQVAASPEPPDVGGRGLVLHSAIVGRRGAPGDLLRTAGERHPSALLLFGSKITAHVKETAESFLG